MASVTLKNIKKVYPFNGDDAKKKKKKKGEEPAKTGLATLCIGGGMGCSTIVKIED